LSGSRSAIRLGGALGDPRVPVRALRGLPHYVANLRRFRSLESSAPPSLHVRLRWLYPRFADRFQSAGVASGHYFHQDIWAARRVHAAHPARHVDVGSRIDGFVAHLLSFREVDVVDVRPLSSGHPGLRFIRADARALPFEDRSIPSLSSLHAVEHVGLGRYGDPLDPVGCFSAMTELRRVLAPGGRLYFSAPIGWERLEFDAHRVFAPETILQAFAELRLIEFAAVDDTGNLVDPAEPSDYGDACYSCGLFVFESAAN
jgi:SAM-dependent methyltransferase